MTDRPTFHRVFLSKKDEYLFSVSLKCLMIVSGFSKERCFSYGSFLQ